MRFKKMNRKAQMEALGLIVIVILLTLGMFFMVKFGLDDEPKKALGPKILVESTLSSLLRTTVDEPGCDFYGSKFPELGKDLLEDCATHNSFDASSCTYDCGVHCCNFFSFKAGELLNETVGKWGNDYELIITTLQGDSFYVLDEAGVVSGEGCKSDRTAATHFLPLEGGGQLRIELFLC